MEGRHALPATCCNFVHHPGSNTTSNCNTLVGRELLNHKAGEHSLEATVTPVSKEVCDTCT